MSFFHSIGIKCNLIEGFVSNILQYFLSLIMGWILYLFSTCTEFLQLCVLSVPCKMLEECTSQKTTLCKWKNGIGSKQLHSLCSVVVTYSLIQSTASPVLFCPLGLPLLIFTYHLSNQSHAKGNISCKKCKLFFHFFNPALCYNLGGGGLFSFFL